jgi:hypothetical protein
MSSPPDSAHVTPGEAVATGGDGLQRRRRDRRIAILFGLICLFVYNANLRRIGAGDSLPARYLPFGIWRYGSVLIDPILETTREGHTRSYWVVRGRADHWVSLYPVVLPVLVAPLYAPAVAYLNARGWTDERLQRIGAAMEKATASLLAAAASALMYLLLRRRAPPAGALLLAAAFAFGTNTWMIGSQALWQHGLAELLLAGALLLVTGPCTARRALATGVLLGLIVANRPPDALLAAAVGLYGLWWAGRRTVWLAAGAVVPVALVLVYNVAATGHLAGAYVIPVHTAFFRNGLLAGIAGLLFSPARGLLVFSPFLLLVPAGFRHTLDDRHTRVLTLAAGAAVLAQILLYAKTDWRAGYSWGPRWLTDLLPLLVWMLPPALAGLRRAGRAAFVAAVCASVAVQAVGAFWYTGESEAAIFAVRHDGSGEMRGAWDPANTPFIVELRHPPAPIDPGLRAWRERSRALGSIDRVTAGGREVEAGAAVEAGATLVVEGWASVDRRPPDSLEVMLDDRPLAATHRFLERPDVGNILHQRGPAGFRVELATAGARPGVHVLSAVAQLRDGTVALPVAQRSFKIIAAAARGGAPPPAAAGPPGAAGGGRTDLAGAALYASSLLRRDQQPAGYWLTSYTQETRFQNPRREMNTFLTAVMIDLLAPVAEAAGLGESLSRARDHLGDQIEPDGLVRYHGLPNGPTIPALGCAITPDADDTSLAWRLAPANHSTDLRAQALAVMARFRTAEGLYRTWLAPRERYQCIDPGADPNPPDVGIQMHVLMLLAQVDAPAAARLCGALRRTAAEPRLWVYYQEAPLVPLLRQIDLRQAGCALRLPEERLRTPVEGQEIWLTAGRLLDRLLGADGAAAAPPVTPAMPALPATSDLLQSLARDDFAPLRANPPLLYHNDLSARTRRFYWSEDFGYALWLRLYIETARRQAGAAKHP